MVVVAIVFHTIRSLAKDQLLVESLRAPAFLVYSPCDGVAVWFSYLASAWAGSKSAIEAKERVALALGLAGIAFEFDRIGFGIGSFIVVGWAKWGRVFWTGGEVYVEWFPGSGEGGGAEWRCRRR